MYIEIRLLKQMKLVTNGKIINKLMSKKAVVITQIKNLKFYLKLLLFDRCGVIHKMKIYLKILVKLIICI